MPHQHWYPDLVFRELGAGLVPGDDGPAAAPGGRVLAGILSAAVLLALQGRPSPGLPAPGPDRDTRARAAAPQRQAPDARHPQEE